MLTPIAQMCGQAHSQLSSCPTLALDNTRQLGFAIERHIASLETHLKRLEQPNSDLDPDARRELRARYRDLLADARAAQQDFHNTVRPLAPASSPQENCTIQNGEMP
jgi:hypothetical protein